MKTKLTKRLIDSLKLAADSRGERYYDTDLTGFGLAIYPTGRKSFFIEYTFAGAQRRMTIGPYGVLTLEDARQRAIVLLGQAISGKDPLEERAAAVAAAAEHKLTFEDWADDYVERMTPRKKNIRNDIRYLGEAKKLWGDRPLDGITTEDVERAFYDQANEISKCTANRWLASVRACLQDAWRKDKIAQNPAMKVKTFPPGPPRARVLSDEELAKVLNAIDALDGVYARLGLKLLVQTGARLSEVLHAKWEDVDLEDGVWRIPSPKAGKPQFFPLSSETAAMLRTTPRMGCYIVAGTVEDKPRSDLKKAWSEVLKSTGIQNAHLHDLRRTFGLHIARKAGLHIASKLLRHSDIRVTERHYAPLGFDELRVALEKRGADVVDLRKEQTKKDRTE